MVARSSWCKDTLWLIGEREFGIWRFGIREPNGQIHESRTQEGQTVLGEQKTKTLLQNILNRSGDQRTEVIVTGKDEQLTRFANNLIHQNVSETNVVVTVRVALGRRVGMATANDLSAAGLERVVETATAAARLQPENPNFPGFPRPRPIPGVNAFDEASAAYSPRQRAQQVGVICRRAAEAGLTASGAFSTAVEELAVANSLGVLAYHAGTLADLVTVVMGENSSGYAAQSAWRVTDLDAPALGDEAIAKTLRGREPRDLEPGLYTVVLEPYATQDFLVMLSYTGMGALSLQEGRSWMDGRVGQQIMSPVISIWDDGLDPSGLPAPFDYEGLPKQRVDLIKAGVAQGVVYDSATANKEQGHTSTGHAVPPEAAASLGPVPLNLFMAPGDAALDEMIASTERGLLVTRFHYTRPVHPRDAVVTGLTRDGTFLIENGEIAYPVKNLRYTQSYLQALANTELVGRELKTLGGYLGVQCVPALKLAEFDFVPAV
jgi:predicted Zn-dependent protease